MSSKSLAKHSPKRKGPDLRLERQYGGLVCGLDEVGRGPLAGPVVAACVLIPETARRKHFWSEINDSKKLSEKKRTALFQPIQEHSHFGLGQCSPEEIDDINIYQASLLAMRRAYEAMCRDFSLIPDHALVDGNAMPNIGCNITTVIKGDTISRSIAAASIIAKVTRDRLMSELHEKHPVYGWSKNSGYGTAQHRNAIIEHGITEHHRRSFAPVRAQLVG